MWNCATYMLWNRNTLHEILIAMLMHPFPQLWLSNIVNNKDNSCSKIIRVSAARSFPLYLKFTFLDRFLSEKRTPNCVMGEPIEPVGDGRRLYLWNCITDMKMKMKMNENESLLIPAVQHVKYHRINFKNKIDLRLT